MTNVLGLIKNPQPEINEEDYVIEKKALNLFSEILPSLNLKTEHLLDFDEENVKSYNSFIINKAYSFSSDTILFANELNRYSDLPKKLQYDFYFYGLDLKRRYNKWIKSENIDNLEAVKEYYDCTTQKAKQYLKILSNDDIENIKRYQRKG